MTDTQVQEGNKLIAEFMGATPCIVRIKSIGDEDGYECEEYKLPTSELEYHTSWDWLMPVVEKIEQEELPLSPDPQKGTGWPTVDIVNKAECEITLKDESICFINSFQSKGDKIKAVWLAVVEFITWYNQTNSK